MFCQQTQHSQKLTEKQTIHDAEADAADIIIASGAAVAHYSNVFTVFQEENQHHKDEWHPAACN
jgi:hypothetical protein